MITNDNIASQIGDAIIFETVPMLNITEVTGFSDDTTGETGIRFFTKDYRLSIDGGVTWTDWVNLNSDPNNILQPTNSIIGNNFNQIVFQFRYVRAGTDNTGTLTLNSVSLNDEQTPRGSVFNISGKGLFKDVVYNNINVINLMINLSRKMYETGIVPAYIIRQEDENGFGSDDAYVDFWQAIAYFYAIISIDAIKFENIYWRRPILCEFLKERNIFLCDCNDIIEMQLIAQNYYTEMRVRGTEEIFKPKGFEYNIGYRNTYDMPNGDYIIEPLSPVQIDGIVYTEVKFLPFGWTLNGDGTVLIAGDRNFHKVLFFDGTNFTIPPDNQSITFPTADSNILKRYNGEYLRLICFNSQCDEFIYNNVPFLYIGWCLSNSSPCYQGLRPQINKSLIKAYEKQQSVQNLAKYPLINSDLVYIGIANNPKGVSDTVMYISADGSPCLSSVLPQLLNVTKHLFVYFQSSVPGINGLLTITNLQTTESFDIPFSIDAGANFDIDTDLVPARYSIEVNITMPTQVTMSGYFDDDAALLVPISSINSTSYDSTNDLSAVQTDVLNLHLNFVRSVPST